MLGEKFMRCLLRYWVNPCGRHWADVMTMMIVLMVTMVMVIMVMMATMVMTANKVKMVMTRSI